MVVAATAWPRAAHGIETLVNPEPGFFLLGVKSYGRNTTFLMRAGWQQVGEVMDELAARQAPLTAAMPL